VQPRVVMRRLLGAGQREDRAIATVMAGCILLFISRWPVRARAAHLEGIDMTRVLSTDAYALIFILPLLLYGIAALSRILARILGGKGTWYGARLALFWAFLATTPLLFLTGLVEGYLGAGRGETAVGMIWFGVFLWIWGACLFESERGVGAVNGAVNGAMT